MRCPVYLCLPDLSVVGRAACTLIRLPPLEAASGFEPEHNGFADRRLNHLAMPPRLRSVEELRVECAYRTERRCHPNRWSGKRDLNPRHPPWQGGALPLSYSRSHWSFHPESRLTRLLSQRTIAVHVSSILAPPDDYGYGAYRSSGGTQPKDRPAPSVCSISRSALRGQLSLPASSQDARLSWQLNSLGESSPPQLSPQIDPLYFGNIRRLKSLITLHYLEFDFLPFSECLESLFLYRREVNKDILTVLAFNEPITFVFIEPLDSSPRHDPLTLLTAGSS